MKWSRLGATLVIVIVVGALALRIWLDNRKLAEQERAIAEQKAALAKLLPETARLQESVPYTLRFQNIYVAYGEAAIKLGRPPKSAEELKPFLKSTDDLLSPRDRQPFEVSWGTPFLGAGAMRIWEATPNQVGGRFVSVIDGGAGIKARYVTEKEFAEFAGKAP